ncbi:MAG: pyridoxine 5'-phosphate synthase [Candidatus Melainabacteria bacterium]|nr:pyridoxine 5'-phosphate synthase [Candidatus Melainabacteria bacterium]
MSTASSKTSTLQSNEASAPSTILLGVNIDHVATLRNARGVHYPDPVQAALLAEAAGADGITAHLREDRRHIRDEDLLVLRQSIGTRLNLEMANTEEMVAIALDIRPDMVTLVPERREELTTEGGLDVVRLAAGLTRTVERLQAKGIPVSLFIDAEPEQILASQQTGAQWIELHTGRYCEAWETEGLQEDGGPLGPETQQALDALFAAAELGHQNGLKINGGHGLHLANVEPICHLPHLVELNIGHSIIADAIFLGLPEAVARMKSILQQKTPWTNQVG